MLLQTRNIDVVSKKTPKTPNSAPPRGKNASEPEAPNVAKREVKTKEPQYAQPIPKIPLARPPAAAIPSFFGNFLFRTK